MTFETKTGRVRYGSAPAELMGDPIFKRDIFSATIEFIKHFPIHFALIDAYISADGPFGIFIDKNLNHTEKIIGSEDIVATD
jgi:hypothetical protein